MTLETVLLARRVLLPFFPSLLLLLFTTGCSTASPGWLKVGGPLYNVGGMAYVGEDPVRGGEQFIVVHDNKKPGEPHVGLITLRRGKARYQKLRWPAETVAAPVDLESVSGVPDAPGRFLALESSGRLFHLRYAGGDALEVLHVTRLPDVPPGANFEGLCVEKMDGRLVAVWAHRGQGDQPAVLFWGPYDLPDDTLTRQGSAEVRVPYPRGTNARAITDLRVDPGGTVWITSVTDPGDDGPFESAVYSAGTLTDAGGGLYRFHPNLTPTRLWTFPKKVEAIELLPGPGGHVYFGSDDEKQGGWVYRSQ